MKKNTALKIERPACLVVEEDRLNSVIDRLEFDLELETRKRILLEQANITRNRNNSAIIERKLSSIQASKKAKIERSKMVLAQERAFVALSASDSRCLPFKDAVQVKAVYGSKACQMEACACVANCKAVCSALPNVKRFTTGTGTNSGRQNAVHFVKTVSKGRIDLESKDHGKLTFSGADYSVACKKIRDHFKANPIAGLTDSAIAGFTHKGAAEKGYPYFAAFQG